jgi:hypothetical protein
MYAIHTDAEQSIIRMLCDCQFDGLLLGTVPNCRGRDECKGNNRKSGTDTGVAGFLWLGGPEMEAP